MIIFVIRSEMIILLLVGSRLRREVEVKSEEAPVLLEVSGGRDDSEEPKAELTAFSIARRQMEVALLHTFDTHRTTHYSYPDLRQGPRTRPEVLSSPCLDCCSC